MREGAEAVICASTGNTAASAAAYAARGGLRGAVIVPEGKIATGKLAQALMHGARVIALRGNFDEALALVRELVQRHPIALVNSVNPFRLEGQKTAAFEVLDALGELDALCIPVGNAGNVTAYWKGFKEMGAAPRLFGFQAEGAAPLVHGKPVANPETVASAIRIGNPARWEEAMEAFTVLARRASPRSATPRSSTPTASWPPTRACSASRRQRRLGRRAAGPRRRRRRARRLRAHRPRPQGPADRALARPARSCPASRTSRRSRRPSWSEPAAGPSASPRPRPTSGRGST